MPKSPNIRWTQAQKKRLEREVKRFNAKIKRVNDRVPEISEFQPQKVSIRELKQQIKTGKDLNLIVNQLARYSVRGAENVVGGGKGLIITKYEKKEVRIKTSRLNAINRNKAKRAGISPEAGTSQMIEQQNLRPKKFSTDKTFKEWMLFKESLEKKLMSDYEDKGYKEYYESYLEAIKNNLGDEGDRLIKKVENVTDYESFFYKSLSDAVLTIGFISDPLDVEVIVNRALAEWENKKIDSISTLPTEPLENVTG